MDFHGLHLLALRFGYLNEVGNFCDFALRGIIIGLFRYVSDFAKSQRQSSGDLLIFSADQTFRQCNFQHSLLPP